MTSYKYVCVCGCSKLPTKVEKGIYACPSCERIYSENETVDGKFYNMIRTSEYKLRKKR